MINKHIHYEGSEWRALRGSFLGAICMTSWEVYCAILVIVVYACNQAVDSRGFLDSVFKLLAKNEALDQESQLYRVFEIHTVGLHKESTSIEPLYIDLKDVQVIFRHRDHSSSRVALFFFVAALKNG